MPLPPHPPGPIHKAHFCSLLSTTLELLITDPSRSDGLCTVNGGTDSFPHYLLTLYLPAALCEDLPGRELTFPIPLIMMQILESPAHHESHRETESIVEGVEDDTLGMGCER